MPNKSAPRVLQTSSTTGTGTLNLDPVAGAYQSWVSGLASSGVSSYVIEDGTDWEVGIGYALSGSPDTFVRARVLASSNSGSLVDFGAGVKRVFNSGLTDWIALPDYRQNLKLSLSETDALPGSDVSNQTTLYMHPWNGSTVWLPTYNVVTLRRYELTGSIPSLTTGSDLTTADKNYDIFLYEDSGSLAVEAVAWTNDTTRASSITKGNHGLYVKTGNQLRVFVGTVRTYSNSGTKLIDSVTKRFVYNHFNQAARPMSCIDTNAHNYTTASWREWNAGASRLEWVDGFARQQLFQYRSNQDTGGSSFGVGFNVNSVSAPGGSKGEQFNNLADAASGDVFDCGVGYNYFAAVEFGAATVRFERVSMYGAILM